MSDILERLRGYNPIDRTSDNIRAAQDIADAADEITQLRQRLAAADDRMNELIRERDDMEALCAVYQKNLET